jgi:hypothetical protein
MPGEEIIFIIISGVLALIVALLVWVTFTGGKIPWVLFKSKLFRGKGVFALVVRRGGGMELHYGKLPKHNIYHFGRGTDAEVSYIQKTKHYLGGIPCYVLIEGETTNPNLVEEYGIPFIDKAKEMVKEEKVKNYTEINLNEIFPYRHDSRLANQATVMAYNQGRIDTQLQALKGNQINMIMLGISLITMLGVMAVAVLIFQNQEKLIALAENISPLAKEAVEKAGSFITTL